MSWSEETWESCIPIYNEILQLPFLKELMDGSLPNEKFLFYLQQDAHYLSEYGKILASIAAKLDSKEWRNDFLHFSTDTVSVEQALHQFYLKDIDKLVEPTPTNLLYTGHMHQQLNSHSLEEATASILPCFWVYKKVGDFIVENQTTNINPYQAWIDTYGGEDFASATQKAISICDAMAQNCTENKRIAMQKAFVYSFKMEWMFWNSAWNMEEWSI